MHDVLTDLIFLFIVLVLFFPALSSISESFEQEEIFDSNSIKFGECVSLFRNVNRRGNSEYRGIFLYSGEYREVELTVNQFINLGGVLIDNCGWFN